MSNEDGSLSADEYMQLVDELLERRTALNVEKERNRLITRGRHTIPPAARDQLLAAMHSVLTGRRDAAIDVHVADDGALTTQDTTWYEAEGADLVIHDVHNLAQRAQFIEPAGSTHLSASTPMLEAIATGEYPSVEAHQEATTPMWEPTYVGGCMQHNEVTIENGRIKRPLLPIPAP